MNFSSWFEYKNTKVWAFHIITRRSFIKRRVSRRHRFFYLCADVSTFAQNVKMDRESRLGASSLIPRPSWWFHPREVKRRKYPTTSRQRISCHQPSNNQTVFVFINTPDSCEDGQADRVWGERVMFLLLVPREARVCVCACVCVCVRVCVCRVVYPGSAL